MAAALKTLVVPAVTKHTATVIFVHGLGDTGYGWQPVADMFNRDSSLNHVKWILPHAPVRAVTANMGMKMPTWFDIYSFGFDSKEDEEGLMASSKSLNKIIEEEVAGGIDASRIVLGGFSQGGAMTLLTGLQPGPKLAGLVVLSGWLPLGKKFTSLAAPDCASIPMFWGHGALDPLVKIDLAKRSVDFLTTKLGFTRNEDANELKGLKFNEYPVEHTTSPAELDDLKEWLAQVVPNN